MEEEAVFPNAPLFFIPFIYGLAYCLSSILLDSACGSNVFASYKDPRGKVGVSDPKLEHPCSRLSIPFCDL